MTFKRAFLRREGSLHCLKVLALVTLFVMVPSSFSGCARSEPAPIRVLIVDGQNNPKVWPKSTMMMKQHLQECGRFEADILRSRPVRWNP